MQRVWSYQSLFPVILKLWPDFNFRKCKEFNLNQKFRNSSQVFQCDSNQYFHDRMVVRKVIVNADLLLHFAFQLDPVPHDARPIQNYSPYSFSHHKIPFHIQSEILTLVNRCLNFCWALVYSAKSRANRVCKISTLLSMEMHLQFPIKRYWWGLIGHNLMKNIFYLNYQSFQPSSSWLSFPFRAVRHQ